MKYFTIAELTASTTATRMGIDNTPSHEVKRRLQLLAENVLDPLREAFGQPVKVNSGYRCRALNDAVGGTASSQHVMGEAADITAGSAALNGRLYGLIKSLALPVDQAINEKGFTWIHVSYGPRHRRSFFAIG